MSSHFLGKTPAEAYAMLAQDALNREEHRLRASSFGYISHEHPGTVFLRVGGATRPVSTESLLALLQSLPDNMHPESRLKKIESALRNGLLKHSRNGSPYVLQVGDRVMAGGRSAEVFAIEFLGQEEPRPAFSVLWSDVKSGDCDIRATVGHSRNHSTSMAADCLAPHDGHVPPDRAFVDFLAHIASQAERGNRKAQTRLQYGHMETAAWDVETVLSTGRRLSALKAMIADLEARRNQDAKAARAGTAEADRARAERRLLRQRLVDVNAMIGRIESGQNADRPFIMGNKLRSELADERRILWARLKEVEPTLRPGPRPTGGAGPRAEGGRISPVEEALADPAQFQAKVLGALRGRFGSLLDGHDDRAVLRRFLAYVESGAKDLEALKEHLDGQHEGSPVPGPRR